MRRRSRKRVTVKTLVAICWRKVAMSDYTTMLRCDRCARGDGRSTRAQLSNTRHHIFHDKSVINIKTTCCFEGLTTYSNFCFSIVGELRLGYCPCMQKHKAEWLVPALFFCSAQWYWFQVINGCIKKKKLHGHCQHSLVVQQTTGDSC